MFKLSANHFVAVHDQPHRLADEVIISEHTPSHHGLIALRLKRELRGIGRLERFQKIKFKADRDTLNSSGCLDTTIKNTTTAIAINIRIMSNMAVLSRFDK